MSRNRAVTISEIGRKAEPNSSESNERDDHTTFLPSAVALPSKPASTSPEQVGEYARAIELLLSHKKESLENTRKECLASRAILEAVFDETREDIRRHFRKLQDRVLAAQRRLVDQALKLRSEKLKAVESVETVVHQLEKEIDTGVKRAEAIMGGTPKDMAGMINRLETSADSLLRIDVEAPSVEDLFFGFCISDTGITIVEEDSTIDELVGEAEEWWKLKRKNELRRTPSGIDTVRPHPLRSEKEGTLHSHVASSLDKKLAEIKSAPNSARGVVGKGGDERGVTGGGVGSSDMSGRQVQEGGGGGRRRRGEKRK
uniref:Uncharacterized protein n=1 Tax=Palpitomonas bilix TaxID=652834 RepID=A0A7S3DG90_9EUKA|mmetsp:Transcript_36314/g.94451  ORF Transcript_36314/g.94451 Transcript_36314/m.94451 type:complete len:315 (+) Transcript_36314:166-1110(+)